MRERGEGLDGEREKEREVNSKEGTDRKVEKKGV